MCWFVVFSCTSVPDQWFWTHLQFSSRSSSSWETKLDQASQTTESCVLNLCRKIFTSLDIIKVKNFPICALYKIRNKNIGSWLYKNIWKSSKYAVILERIYSSCCQNASPLFWDLSGAGSWFAESITDTILSLQWGSLSAADESATGTAFWLSLFQQPYSCRFYIYLHIIFLIFFNYYFS